nr:MAG TPA: hypothetical protein [Caudoviricetes sp.]
MTNFALLIKVVINSSKSNPPPSLVPWGGGFAIREQNGGRNNARVKIYR